MDGGYEVRRPPLERAQTSDREDIALLPSTNVPSIQVSTALDDDTSSLRGRRHSRDLSSIDVLPSDYVTDEEAPASPSTHVRRLSPKPSAAENIIKRITTIRHSAKRSRTQRRAQGGSYDHLDDTTIEPVAVDLSSLEGMGFELTEMRTNGTPTTPRWQDENTSYDRSPQSPKPDFRSFVRRSRTPKLGDGMVIGAQLRRDPSRAAAHTTSNDALAPDDTLQRSLTTRNVGQSLAEERQMMVAVAEHVDLSSYDGATFDPHASVASLQALTMENVEEKSYFFPQDPDIPNWKPFSMRWPYITMLAVISLGLAGFQEWLYQHSEKRIRQGKGGLLEFDRVSQVSIPRFFAWKYLPTLITVGYAVLFSIMDFDIRRLEPFHQLSKRQGSKASASLNLDHMTMFQYFVPVKALRLRQWVVFFSTVGNIIASTAAPALQNPSLIFVQNPDCPPSIAVCPNGRKHYFVRVSSAWSRVLSGTLIVVALTAIIIFFLLRRRSGLLSDPKGIAGIASMATKSHILNDFRGLDLATRAEIHERLAHRRYVLYKSSIWQGEWTAVSEPMQESKHRLDSPHPHMLQLRFGFPFLSFMVFGLIAVPVISLSPARVIPNAVPWLPILLATILKLLFSTFESDVRLMEPFYQLSRGHASPTQSLTLDYGGTVYGWVVLRAALNRHWLVSLVGVASIALDVLTVTVSSFSINSDIFLQHPTDLSQTSNQDETFFSFWISLVLSILILLFVIAVTGLVYFRRRHPFLPREPSTIAAVLAFIYASNMLDDFIDTEFLSNREMEERLTRLGKTYALGWFRGRDGKVHCAIDQEPLRSKYVHGKPYTMAQAPWEGSGMGGGGRYGGEEWDREVNYV